MKLKMITVCFLMCLIKWPFRSNLLAAKCLSKIHDVHWLEKNKQPRPLWSPRSQNYPSLFWCHSSRRWFIHGHFGVWSCSLECQPTEAESEVALAAEGGPKSIWLFLNVLYGTACSCELILFKKKKKKTICFFKIQVLNPSAEQL